MEPLLPDIALACIQNALFLPTQTPVHCIEQDDLLKEQSLTESACNLFARSFSGEGGPGVPVDTYFWGFARWGFCS